MVYIYIYLIRRFATSDDCVCETMFLVVATLPPPPELIHVAPNEEIGGTDTTAFGDCVLTQMF